MSDLSTFSLHLVLFLVNWIYSHMVIGWLNQWMNRELNECLKSVSFHLIRIYFKYPYLNIYSLMILVISRAHDFNYIQWIIYIYVYKYNKGYWIGRIFFPVIYLRKLLFDFITSILLVCSLVWYTGVNKSI